MHAVWYENVRQRGGNVEGSPVRDSSYVVIFILYIQCTLLKKPGDLSTPPKRGGGVNSITNEKIFCAFSSLFYYTKIYSSSYFILN